MTAQIHDSFLLQDKTYSVVGVNGGSLFHPQDQSMQHLPRITSCWRGYVCTYKISDSKLLLDSLQVNLAHEGPAINNIPRYFHQEVHSTTSIRISTCEWTLQVVSSWLTVLSIIYMSTWASSPHGSTRPSSS